MLGLNYDTNRIKSTTTTTTTVIDEVIENVFALIGWTSIYYVYEYVIMGWLNIM